jgi:CBS domain containing-hemolysin-like protein
LVAGVFVCADTALTSLSAARLGALAKESGPRYRRALERVVAHRSTVQSRYLAWRVISVCGAAGCMALWQYQLPLDGLRHGAVSFGLLLAIAIVIEVSSAIGRQAADWLVPAIALFLGPLELAMAPLAFVTSGFARLASTRKKGDPRITGTEVEIILDEGARTGMLEQEPAELMRNVLGFSELTARDAMVPRTRVTAIKIDTPIEQVLQTITDTGHSRYPVYREDMDDIFGLLCAKDLFRVLRQSWRPLAPEPGDEESEQPLEAARGKAERRRSAATPSSAPDSDTPSQRSARLLDIVQEPVRFVSETQPLAALLAEMRLDRQHLAVVVDQYGGTSGIVTLEDILEEIVGDIQDEHDGEEAPIVHDDKGRLIADAAVPISDLSAYLGSELDPEGQYESLGGMLTEMTGEVPPVGTTIRVDGMRFIIHESDEKHISKVLIVRAPAQADASGPFQPH